MTASFAIAGHDIGESRAPFVVAEAGVNHNGDAALAMRLIDAAADAGADAVKFQTFDAGSLATAGAERAAYQRTDGEAGTQLQMLRALELGRDEWRRLRSRADERRILFLSTPFDEASVELLTTLDVPAYKIGSGDLTNAILLRQVGARRRPVILSTGMGTLSDVAAAIAELDRAGADGVALLHCTSAYPADLADLNLRAMDELRARFRRIVGLSDHSDGLVAPVAATARGAAIIEKHLTLDRGLPGPDHAASLDPMAFARMVREVRGAWDALGDGRKEPRPAEMDTMRVARRSLVTRRALPAGRVIAADDLDAKRPGTGISPMLVDGVVGRRLRVAVGPEHLLRPQELDPPLD